MLPHEMNFEELWLAATAWAKEQEAIAHTRGQPLSEREKALAKRVKVSRPELVKVFINDPVPVPTEGILFEFYKAKGFNKWEWSGLTVGHCVFLRQGAEKTKYFAHELCHVGQYERFGTVKDFMASYVKELDEYEYPKGPLESEAVQAEKEFGLWLADPTTRNS